MSPASQARLSNYSILKPIPGRRLGNCRPRAKLGLLHTIAHGAPRNRAAGALLCPRGRDLQTPHQGTATQRLPEPFRFALHDNVQHVLPVVSIHNLSQHPASSLLRRHCVREGEAVE